MMVSEKIKEKIKDKNGKIYYNPKGAFVSRRDQRKIKDKKKLKGSDKYYNPKGKKGKESIWHATCRGFKK